MKEQVNIMCLYWVGDFRGRNFTVEDVVRLKRNVDVFIDRPYTFYCLTNTMQEPMPEDIKKIELIYAWPGWWSKMELHRPDLPPGRTLYIDLDTYIISDLGPMLDLPGDLVMFDTRIPKKLERMAGIVCRYQSSVMLFTPGAMIHVWERFKKHPNIAMRKFRSDQDCMGKWIPDQPLFPDHWMVKMVNCESMRKPSKDLMIITGQPKGRSFRDVFVVPWLEKILQEKKCM